MELKLNYDKKFDILYIAFEDQYNSYGDDDSLENAILRRDIEDDHITGVTIMDFKKKLDEDIQEKFTEKDIEAIKSIRLLFPLATYFQKTNMKY